MKKITEKSVSIDSIKKNLSVPRPKDKSKNSIRLSAKVSSAHANSQPKSPTSLKQHRYKQMSQDIEKSNKKEILQTDVLEICQYIVQNASAKFALSGIDPAGVNSLDSLIAIIN